MREKTLNKPVALVQSNLSFPSAVNDGAPRKETWWILGTESHAYFIDPQPGDADARSRLFETFYAAMAALE